MCSWSKYARMRSLLAHCVSVRYSKRLMSDVRVRFAPSPTGEMHLGSLRTALYNYLYARKYGGQFLLRIEDTDQTRVVPGAAERIVETLRWAGLCPDEGPGLGGTVGPYVQSERIKLYQEYAHKLLESGHAYRCYCSEGRLEILRKNALRNQEVPRYDNCCRSLPREAHKEGQPYTVRLKLTEGDLTFDDGVHGPVTLDISKTEGDPVVLKSDGFPTYHLACVVDDRLMGVTDVLRGVEWQVSTPKHLMLYHAFGWEPPRFWHLPLLLNKDGTKLSKRRDDIQVNKLREQGFSPEAVVNLLVLAGGGFGKQGKDQFLQLPEMVDKFSPDDLRTGSCRLDTERLQSLNRLHLQSCLGSEEGTLLLARQLQQLLPSQQLGSFTEQDIMHVLHQTKDRISSLHELLTPDMSFIWSDPIPGSHDEQWHKPETLAAVSSLCNQLESLDGDQFNRDVLSSLLRSTASEAGLKFSDLMHHLRLLLSGLKQGPGVAEMLVLLGKERALRRLQQAELPRRRQDDRSSIKGA